MKNPTGFELANEPGIKWAAAMMLAEKMDDNNAGKVLDALSYIGVEYAHVAVSFCFKRLGAKTLMAFPQARKWIIDYAKKYHMATE